MEETKQQDPMVKFKNVSVGENSKGGTYIKLALSKEEAAYLVEQLQNSVTDRGARLDVHISKKQTNDGKRTFDSGVAFIRGIQEPQNPTAGRGSVAPAASKPADAGSDLQNRVNNLRAQRK